MTTFEHEHDSHEESLIKPRIPEDGIPNPHLKAHSPARIQVAKAAETSTAAFPVSLVKQDGKEEEKNLEIIEEFYANSTCLVEGQVNVEDNGEVAEEEEGLRTEDVAIGSSEREIDVGMMEVEGVLGGGQVYGFDAAAVVASTKQEICHVPEELDSNDDDDMAVSAAFPDLDQDQGVEMIVDEPETENQEESVVENPLLDSSDNHVQTETPYNDEKDIFFESISSERVPDSLEESNGNVKDDSVMDKEQVEEENGDLQDNVEYPLEYPLDAEDNEINANTDFPALEKQEVEDSDGDVDLTSDEDSDLDIDDRDNKSPVEDEKSAQSVVKDDSQHYKSMAATIEFSDSEEEKEDKVESRDDDTPDQQQFTPAATKSPLPLTKKQKKKSLAAAAAKVDLGKSWESVMQLHLPSFIMPTHSRSARYSEIQALLTQYKTNHPDIYGPAVVDQVESGRSRRRSGDGMGGSRLQIYGGEKGYKDFASYMRVALGQSDVESSDSESDSGEEEEQEIEKQVHVDVSGDAVESEEEKEESEEEAAVVEEEEESDVEQQAVVDRECGVCFSEKTQYWRGTDTPGFEIVCTSCYNKVRRGEILFVQKRGKKAKRDQDEDDVEESDEEEEDDVTDGETTDTPVWQATNVSNLRDRVPIIIENKWKEPGNSLGKGPANAIAIAKLKKAEAAAAKKKAALAAAKSQVKKRPTSKSATTSLGKKSRGGVQKKKKTPVIVKKEALRAQGKKKSKQQRFLEFSSDPETGELVGYKITYIDGEQVSKIKAVVDGIRIPLPDETEAEEESKLLVAKSVKKKTSATTDRSSTLSKKQPPAPKSKNKSAKAATKVKEKRFMEVVVDDNGDEQKWIVLYRGGKEVERTLSAPAVADVSAPTAGEEDGEDEWKAVAPSSLTRSSKRAATRSSPVSASKRTPKVTFQPVEKEKEVKATHLSSVLRRRNRSAHSSPITPTAASTSKSRKADRLPSSQAFIETLESDAGPVVSRLVDPETGIKKILSIETADGELLDIESVDVEALGIYSAEGTPRKRRKGGR